MRLRVGKMVGPDENAGRGRRAFIEIEISIKQGRALRGLGPGETDAGTVRIGPINDP